MKSEKILDLAKKLNAVDQSIGYLNSGNTIQVTFTDGKRDSVITISASPDDKKGYKLSNAISNSLAEYRGEVVRDLMSVVRPHERGR